jgi:hypothetical protein
MTFLEIDSRTDEVNTNLIGGSDTTDVIPQLLALLLRPGVGALVDRDDERRDGARDLKGLGFCGFRSGMSISEVMLVSNLSPTWMKLLMSSKNRWQLLQAFSGTKCTIPAPPSWESGPECFE